MDLPHPFTTPAALGAMTLMLSALHPRVLGATGTAAQVFPLTAEVTTTEGTLEQYLHPVAGTEPGQAAGPPDCRAPADTCALIRAWKEAMGGAAWDTVQRLHVSGTTEQSGARGRHEEWV